MTISPNNLVIQRDCLPVIPCRRWCVSKIRFSAIHSFAMWYLLIIGNNIIHAAWEGDSVTQSWKCGFPSSHGNCTIQKHREWYGEISCGNRLVLLTKRRGTRPAWIQINLVIPAMSGADLEHITENLGSYVMSKLIEIFKSSSHFSIHRSNAQRAPALSSRPRLAGKSTQGWQKRCVTALISTYIIARYGETNPWTQS